MNVTAWNESADAPAAPAPAPAHFRRVSFKLKGGVMAGIAFGEETRAPDILFLHATGFNALTYRTLLAPLGERFHVVAIDLRGHGRSTLKLKQFGYVSWRRHRDDVIQLLERHFTQPVTLAGHSMGATVSLLAAGKRPDLVGGLALIEPVILGAGAYALAELPGGPLVMRLAPIAQKAARRRRRFASRDEAVTLLSQRGIFRGFPREVMQDYAEDGFVDGVKGDVKLACKPAYEAATFAAHRHNPWAALPRVSGPIVLLRAEKGSTISQAAAQRIAALRADARIATVEGAGHMLPMERPDRVRSAIETAALMASPTRPFRDLV